MRFWAALLSALIPKLLELLIKYQQDESARQKSMKVIVKERARLKRAIDGAFDGDAITDEQRKELIDAARTLISNY